MTLLAILVTAVGIAVSLVFTSSDGYGSKITLPDKSGQEEIDIEEVHTINHRLVEEIEVNRLNALGIIGQLKRPNEYHFKATNSVYSGDKFLSTVTEGYVKGENALLTLYDGDEAIQNTVITKNSVYIWAEGSKRYKKLGKGSFTYDDISAVASYEQLLKYDSLINAYMEQEDGNLYVVAEALNDVTGIEEKYRISVSSGLLSEVSFEKDGTVTAKAVVELIGTDEIPLSVFTLPDGTIPTE